MYEVGLILLSNLLFFAESDNGIQLYMYIPQNPLTVSTFLHLCLCQMATSSS